MKLVLSFFLISTFLLTGCMSMFMPDFIEEEKKLSEAFKKNNPESLHSLSFDHRPIRYAQIGATGKPKIIFVHGSPGGWSNFIRQMNHPKLQRDALMISADRLGYGGSDHGKPERSLDQQAQAMIKLFELDDPKQSIILVGHSFGGPIVARMAMLQDPRIQSTIILAGSVDPELEDNKWYQYFAEWGFIRWMVPTDLVTCNREILALQNELKRILPDWSRIKSRVVVLQGQKDKLVDPRNADFIQAKFPQAEVIRLPEAGHILTAYNQDEVLKLIEQELKRIKRP